MKLVTLKNRFYLSFMFGLIANFAFGQWNNISNQGDGKVFFVNDTLGFGFGQRTLDGGKTWQEMTQRTNSSLFFTTDKVGYMVSNNATKSNVYYKTTDGGLTWVDKSNVYPGIGGILDFPSPDTGYVICQNEVYKTIDAGESWQKVKGEFQLSSFKHSIDFVTNDIGFVATDAGGTSNSIHLFTTRDGGDSWEWNEIPFKYQNPFSGTRSVASSATDVFAISVYELKSEILYSADAGRTWTSQFRDTGVTLSDIQFPTRDTGYVVGFRFDEGTLDTGMVLKTTDRGTTWKVQRTHYQKPIHSCHFINGSTGWLAGYNGAILHTTNGGHNLGVADVRSAIKWRLVPNPMTSQAVLETDTQIMGKKELTIYSMNGQSIGNYTYLTGEALIIDASHLTSGLYFFHLTADNQHISGKFEVR